MKRQLLLKIGCVNLDGGATTFSITTLSIRAICDTQHKHHLAETTLGRTTICIERHYAQCRNLFIVMLNVIMLSVVILNVLAPGWRRHLIIVTIYMIINKSQINSIHRQNKNALGPYLQGFIFFSA
jgi:hypothetical protein